MYLQNLTADKSTEYSLWKATKRPKMQATPIKKDNDEWARSDMEKAEIFADLLERTFQPLKRQTYEYVKLNAKSTSNAIKQV